MSKERIASLIHNARNRLCLISGGLAEKRAVEVQAISSQLASAMALLRLDDAERGIQRQEVDLELFISDLMEEVANLAPPHLSTVSTTDLSACLYGSWIFDTELIRLVLVDGFMNAWRYARTRVCLEATCHTGELHFILEDDGSGYPARWLDAWDKPDAAYPAPHGTGHGLRLAERIAKMHSFDGRQGRIKLSNNAKSGGARFCLILP